MNLITFTIALAAALPAVAQRAPAHVATIGGSHMPALNGRGLPFGTFDQTRVPAQEVGRTFSRPSSTFSRPSSTFSQPSFIFPPFAFNYPNVSGRFFNGNVAPIPSGAHLGFPQPATTGSSFAYNPFTDTLIFPVGSRLIAGGASHNVSSWGPYNRGYQFPLQKFDAQQSGGAYSYGYGGYPFGWGGTPTVFVLNQEAQQDAWTDEVPPQGFAQAVPASAGANPMGESSWPQPMPMLFDPQVGWIVAPNNFGPQTMPPPWMIAQSPPPQAEPVIIDFPPGTRILR